MDKNNREEVQVLVAQAASGDKEADRKSVV